MKDVCARILAFVAVFAVAFAVSAAPQPPAIKTNFPKQPDAARVALKAAVGKPFSSGYVFIDGKYLEPPYKVERFGSVIRINGIQVTGEVVPWNAFIRTQEGVKVTKSESAPAPEGEAAPEPEPEPEPTAEELDDAWENSLDDLFDDEPSAKKKPAKKSGATYKPRPKKPTVTVTYSFDGEFVHNDKSKALLARINAYRTKIDTNLRQGGCYCFSSHYPMETMDPGATRHIMNRLPNLMKTSLDLNTFSQAIHAANIPFSEPLIADIFKNRFDYLKLTNRIRKEKDPFY